MPFMTLPFATVCQASAATEYVTWSAVPTVGSALQTALMATSACAHLASGELCVKRVSQLTFVFFYTQITQEEC